MWRTSASGKWITLESLAIAPTTALSASRNSSNQENIRRQTVARRLSQEDPTRISPPDVGGQDVPQPVPQVHMVDENYCSLLPGSEDMSPFLLANPVKPEIKVSSLKSALFYLDKGKIIVDRHLPDPEPVFLTRLAPHSRFTPPFPLGFVMKYVS